MTTMQATGRTVITLDGPAASGKSSVARLLAERLAVAYVSSGLLYRAVTLIALEGGADTGDEEAMMRLLAGASMRLIPDPGGNRVLVGDRDVTAWLHTDAVDAAVSAVARQAQVRVWVNERLKEIAGSFVIDGRDMGTTVFPEAEHKFYLTAPVAVRARRRLGERAGDLAAVTAALSQRDALDAKQSVPASDAIHIDTGPLALEEVVDAVQAALDRGAAAADRHVASGTGDAGSNGVIQR